MIKKMRIRFIMSAMLAFMTVIILLTAGINIFNYVNSTEMADSMLDRIMQFEQREPIKPDGAFPKMDNVPGAGPEAEFTTRFFAVHYKSDGSVAFLSRDYIASVDKSTAIEYANKVNEKGKTKGYYSNYRYQIAETGNETIVLFLDSTTTINFIKTLLVLSIVIDIVICLVLLLLIIVFSNKAIQPFVNNIKRQKQFITDAGHELKTPITSIATSADIAAMEHEGDEWIENIQKQTLRLSKLVNNLVAMSRLDEDNPFPDKSQFSLSDAAWEISEPFAVMAKAKGKRYSQEIEENIDYYGNKSAVQQLISILLDNAIKYSGEDGEIQFSVRTVAKKRIISVSNTCTLDRDFNLNRLFERFYRAEESHSTSTGGTGIGLSMAKAITENLKGKIEASRNETGMITFKVTI